MISPNFYNKKNLVTQFFEAKIPHYSAKDASITVEWYEYIVKDNETLYKIAARIFGTNLEYMWTYIADNNPPRLPDDWTSGDILRLPKVIIRDSNTIKTTYSHATSSSTSI